MLSIWLCVCYGFALENFIVYFWVKKMKNGEVW